MFMNIAFMKTRYRLAIVTIVVGAVSGVTQAGDLFYLPDAGGSWGTCGNWSTGSCPGADDVYIFASSNTVNKIVDLDITPPLVLDYVGIDGNSARYAMLLQTSNLLITREESISVSGEAWHWMESDASLYVLGDLDVGDATQGYGHFHLNCVADSGVLVSDYTYVGLFGPGDFDHLSGSHYCHGLTIADGGPGTYWLKGPIDASTLTVEGRATVGGNNPGLFEQTGGTFRVIPGDFLADLYVGWPGSGVGTYNMKAGVLECDSLHVGSGSRGTFNHSGGSVTAILELVIGSGGSDPNGSTYTLNEDDGTATLDVDGYVTLGYYSPGTYEQTAGTATVDDKINVYADGDLNIGGGTLNTPEVSNAGNITMSGGEFQTTKLTNHTSQKITLNHGALRVGNLYNNEGRIELWNDAVLSGPSAGGGLYYLCDLDNQDVFEMGDDTFDGGTFAGILTNYGTFTYWHGDFSDSTLINHGYFNHLSPFTCRRLVNHANIAMFGGDDISVDGAGYTYAVENYGTLTIYPNAPLSLTGGKPLLNEGRIYGGATIGQDTSITGDVINKGIFWLSHLANATGNLNINGDFSCSNDAELRVRIGGEAWASEHDRLTVLNNAALAGTLNVELHNGYVPALGDRFGILRFGSQSGAFDPVNLPTLPVGSGWRVSYWAGGLTLIVAEPGDFEGDGDIDLDDYVSFEDCMNGPRKLPHPFQTTADQCLAAFDFEADSDVDATDFAEFQLAFAG